MYWLLWKSFGLRVIRRNCNWQIKLGKFLHKVLRSHTRTWVITYVYDAVRLCYNLSFDTKKIEKKILENRKVNKLFLMALQRTYAQMQKNWCLKKD
jgi:hypothetical protein